MENTVETNQVNYQFTAVPTKLMILLDNKCKSMLFTLIQLSSCYAGEDGYFFRTNLDLVQESDLSQHVVIATIDTLYTKRIIDVKSVGKQKGKQANNFKINFDKFEEYDKYSMEDLKNPLFKIEMINYKVKGYSPSYLPKKEKSLEKDLSNVSQKFLKVPTKSEEDCYNDENLPNLSENNSKDFPKISQSANNIDNITNIDNIYNKENIIKIYNKFITLDNIIDKVNFINNLEKEEVFTTLKKIVLCKAITKEEYKIIMSRSNIQLERFQLNELNSNAKCL